MTELLVALVVGTGLALVVTGLLRRGRARQDAILAYLELPFGEEDVEIGDLAERTGLLAPSSASAMDDVLAHLHLVDRIGVRLEAARVPLRPGEFVLLVATVGAALGVWSTLATGQLALGVLAVVLTPPVAAALLSRRVAGRRRAFEEQLPSTLSLLAASLRSGHTLQRGIENLVAESPTPMSEELERVVAETRLGLPLVDALDRMADRVGIQDVEWIVHAIRVQQQTGGKLADLLFTLSEYMRSREEVRREVRVLTAEGRLSAAVLAGMPFLVAVWIQVRNPEYLASLTSGFGLLLAGFGVFLMAIGLFVITRMIKAVDL